jgi:hypothetical protein
MNTQMGSSSTISTDNRDINDVTSQNTPYNLDACHMRLKSQNTAKIKAQWSNQFSEASF